MIQRKKTGRYIRYYWGILLKEIARYLKKKEQHKGTLQEISNGLHIIFKKRFYNEIIEQKDELSGYLHENWSLTDDNINNDIIYQYVTFIQAWAANVLNIYIPDPKESLLDTKVIPTGAKCFCKEYKCPYYGIKRINNIRLPFCKYLKKAGVPENLTVEDHTELLEYYSSQEDFDKNIPLDLLYSGFKYCLINYEI